MWKELSLLCLIWGCNWSVMRVSNDFFSPLACATLRFCLGAAVLLAVSLAMRRPLPQRRHWPWLILVGATQVAWNNVAIQMCISDLGAGVAAVINYCMPLWMAVMAHFVLRERLTGARIGGLLISIAGIALLTGMPGDRAFGLEPFLWGLSSSLSWAAGSILVKTRLKDCDAMTITTWQMAVGAAVLAAACAAIPQPAPVWTWHSASLMAYNGILASALAFFLWMRILGGMEAARAGAFVLLVPVVGVLSGMIFLGETLSPAGLAGIVLVLSGIRLVQRAPRAAG